MPVSFQGPGQDDRAPLEVNGVESARPGPGPAALAPPRPRVRGAATSRCPRHLRSRGTGARRHARIGRATPDQVDIGSLGRVEALRGPASSLAWECSGRRRWLLGSWADPFRYRRTSSSAVAASVLSFRYLTITGRVELKSPPLGKLSERGPGAGDDHRPFGHAQRCRRAASVDRLPDEVEERCRGGELDARR